MLSLAVWPTGLYLGIWILLLVDFLRQHFDLWIPYLLMKLSIRPIAIVNDGSSYTKSQTLTLVLCNGSSSTAYDYR